MDTTPDSMKSPSLYLQAKLYDDDGGNRIIKLGNDVDELKAAAEAYHRDEYEGELEWTLWPSGAWVSQYEAGMQYVVEKAEVVQG